MDEALTDPCPFVDEGQSLRAVKNAVAAKKRWMKVSSLCKGLIRYNLKKRITDSDSKTEIAKEIWDSLEKQYKDDESIVKIQGLQVQGGQAHASASQGLGANQTEDG